MPQTPGVTEIDVPPEFGNTAVVAFPETERPLRRAPTLSAAGPPTSFAMPANLPAKPARRRSARHMPKLMTPVGEPIKLDLVTPLHVVDADVVLLSGYRVDDERPPDEDPGPLGLPKEAGPGGKGGACTNALLQFLYESTPDDTWLSTIVGMHRFCRTHGYEQQPQLSVGNHRFNFRRNFSALHPRCRGNPRRAERRTKALLVGCNYLGSDVELEGAWNDVDKMRRYLVEEAGYHDHKDTLRVLRDNGTDPAPTRANLERALRWLVKGARRGDSLFLHFSGHTVVAPAADDVDDDDEALVPSDFAESGVIQGDFLYRTCLRNLPEGVSLVAVMDGCHGGAPADLGYRFRLSDAQFAHEAERLAKKIPLVSNPAMELLHAAVHFLPNTTKRALSLSLKVTDLVCEGASEVLQRVATSVPLRMFKMAYLHSRKGTGWKLAVQASDVRTTKFVQ